METPEQVIKHEKRKSLIMLGYISLGLTVFGAGFFIAGFDVNDSITRQAGIIMVIMGVIGGILYIWGRKHPVKRPPDRARYTNSQKKQSGHQYSTSHR